MAIMNIIASLSPLEKTTTGDKRLLVKMNVSPILTWIVLWGSATRLYKVHTDP